MLFRGSAHLGVRLDPEYRVAMAEKNLGQDSRARSDIGDRLLGAKADPVAKAVVERLRVARPRFRVGLRPVGESEGGILHSPSLSSRQEFEPQTGGFEKHEVEWRGRGGAR